MKLGDKSERADRPEVRLARDSMGIYTLQSLEYWDANEITDEGEFPKYGDFLKCRTTTGGADPEWNVEVFVECPLGLEAELLELGIEDGDCFRIQQVSKTTDGEWSYQVVEDSLTY
jgi:hypothetical protein